MERLQRLRRLRSGAAPSGLDAFGAAGARRGGGPERLDPPTFNMSRDGSIGWEVPLEAIRELG